jgi:flagellar motor switch protein FliN
LSLSGNEKNNVMTILSSAISSGEKMLSELLGKSVTLALSNADSADAGAIGAAMPGKNLVVPSDLGDGMGTVVMVVSLPQAAVMADLMIGQDGSNPPADLEDLHLSAVTELTNQVIDTVVSNVSSQVATTLMAVPGEVSVIDLDAGVIPSLNDEILLAETDITIGELGAGKLSIVFAGQVAELIKEGQKAEASSVGFVSDVTGGAKVKSNAASAQKVLASELREEAKGTVYDQSLDIVLDVPLQVTVELGRTEKLVRDILELSPGSVIELDKLAGEPVDILVNQKYIAKGEVVVIDENFGIRITDIIRPADRIPKI